MPVGSSLAVCRLANDLVHFGKHVVEADPTIPVGLRASRFERRDERRNLGLGRLQKTHTRLNDFGRITIAARRDCISGELFELGREKSAIHG